MKRLILGKEIELMTINYVSIPLVAVIPPLQRNAL